jgi:hypothetical protein
MGYRLIYIGVWCTGDYVLNKNKSLTQLWGRVVSSPLEVGRVVGSRRL